MRNLQFAILGLVCLAISPRFSPAAEPAAATEANEFFERKVRPLLVEKCQGCHGEKKSKGSLRFLSREAVLQGGDNGPAAVAGKPEDSLLIKAIEYADDLKMPPDGKLADGDIAILKRWVELGVPWPESPTATNGHATAGQTGWTDDQRQWWSFQPLRPVVPPSAPREAAIENSIDRFLEVQIAAAGVKPFPRASKLTLIRRATFDLVGLPPAPHEIEAFINDNAPGAFGRVVDRLLASPQYGERWGRHWLDLVRYADYFEDKPGSHGSAAKFEIFEAWRYRDWVVESFNRDLPYDQFIVHQIAGDKLRGPNGQSPYTDGLVATTVLAIGAWDNGDADKDKVVSDIVDDQIDVIGQAFLGLTLACARCHDHKFDPVSTKDYYALAGMFYSTHVLEHVGTKGDHTVLLRTPLVPQDYIVRRQQQLDRLAQIKSELDKLQAAKKSSPLAGAKPAEEPTSSLEETQAAMTRLAGEREALQQELLPEPPKALGACDGGTPGGTFTGIQDVAVHIRGSYTKLGPVVPRRLPEFFAGSDQPPIREGSGRLELARWIAHP